MAVASQAPVKEARGKRRTEVGLVTSDKMNKTRRVEIPRLVRHTKYNKYIKRRTICYVHDEKNESRMGDTVEIMESRRLSKLKSWRLVKVVAKAKAGTAELTPEAEQPAV